MDKHPTEVVNSNKKIWYVRTVQVLCDHIYFKHHAELSLTTSLEYANINIYGSKEDTSYMNFIRNPSGFFNNKESDMKLHLLQTSPLIAPILQPNLRF
jgi:hypothetical protein